MEVVHAITSRDCHLKRIFFNIKDCAIVEIQLVMEEKVFLFFFSIQTFHFEIIMFLVLRVEMIV